MTTTTPHTTPDTPTFTVRDATDLVALAPIVLGFTPTDSVVLEGLVGPRPFHARVDLPGRRDLDRAAADELADTLVSAALGQGTRGVALLFHSEDAAAVDRAWRALRRHCARRGLQVLDGLRVVPGRYHPLTGPRRLRETGVPIDLARHRFTAAAVAAGMVTRGSRAELAATLDPDVTGRDAVARLLDRHARTSGATTIDGEWAAGLVADHVADGTPADVDDVAHLVASLPTRSVRDRVAESVTRRTATGHVAFWSDVVRRAPAVASGAPAAILALAAWRAGDGALAWIAVDRCREVDSADPVAARVALALERAVPPDADLPDVRR
ncbi:DUF4192 domain-containing protein [Nocardioides panacisoli]|uniref:DUF4192 domain-containing protein n=1 Tax=Nocardioides panacisoli TaxID=627624 RepID=UPI001C62AFF1|nr:DUF4192 domain-containing protein [Nocardioides panacisoli]QYJ04804.1 DUF4192 domain-containing protein [Nocardioides panacisoli]